MGKQVNEYERSPTRMFGELSFYAADLLVFVRLIFFFLMSNRGSVWLVVSVVKSVRLKGQSRGFVSSCYRLVGIESQIVMPAVTSFHTHTWIVL